MLMTINDLPVSLYGATLLSVDYGFSKVTNYTNWLRGAKSPLFHGQDTTYTTATYTVLVEGANLAETEANCSNLVAAMNKAVIKSNADWSLDGHLTDASTSNKISPLARELEISFEGVKMADRETLSHTFALGEAWTFEAKGNQEVPCRIDITPDMGYLDMALTINGKEFHIKNVSSTALLLLIDSERGIVTMDSANKIEDYQSWELPFIKGGLNTISVNGAPSIDISYNGRWM